MQVIGLGLVVLMFFTGLISGLNGNYLLCMILLGNVAVNSTISILIDGLTMGGNAAIATTVSTNGIIDCQIWQNNTAGYGLYVGRVTIPITVVFMILTSPLTLPLGLILNCIVGQELSAIFNCDELLCKKTGKVNKLSRIGSNC